MYQILNKLKIVHKLNFSFGFLVLSVFGLIAFSYISMLSLKDVFSEYRAQARESLILANLSEDLSDARMAALKFRLNDTDEAKNEVFSNVQEIIDLRPQIIDIVTNQDHADRLIALEERAVEYSTLFSQATAQQDLRHEVVAKLDSLGPKIRKDLSEIMESAYRDSDAVAAYYAGRAQQYLMLMRLYAQKFLLNNNAEDITRTQQESKKAMKELEFLFSELQNPKRRALANAVVAGLSDYDKYFAQAASIIQKRNEIYAHGLDTIGPEILDGYDGLFEEVQDKQNYLGPKAVKTMNNISLTSILVGLAIGALAALFAVYIGRFISASFRLIITQMRKLSDGDTSFEIAGTQRKDEIGEMSQALDLFRSGMIERDALEAQAREKQKEDMARTERITKSVAHFEDIIEKIVNTLVNSSGDLNGLAGNLSTALSQTSQQSSSMSSASLEASSNVQTVAAAAEEMAASIKEISRNVTDTATTAKGCADAATLSQEKLRDLQQAVDEIDSVIQSINEVAEQTNLLALNATIEAARAGDAGKGFAVVASEVKALANETHKMTEEISHKVGDIKGSANETITSVNDIIEQISSVDHKTTSVASAIEQQNSSTSEISRNVQEAANGTGEVSRGLEEVQKATNDSAESTEQLKEAANDLAGQSNDLKVAVDRFLKEVKS